MTDQIRKLPVYFGYWDADKYPAEAIHGVRQVIAAMSDLLQGYRDPNDLGTSPNGDTRAGIRHIFEACTQQLEAVADQVAGLERDLSARSEPSDTTDIDRIVAACRMHGLKFDPASDAAQDDQDMDMRLRFESVATREKFDAAMAKFAITEPVAASQKRQSA